MKASSFLRLLSLVTITMVGAPAFAGSVSGLTTFVSGTPAKAADVNGNFNSVATAVNDNNTRIATLEAKVAQLQTQLANLANVAALNQYLTVTPVSGGAQVRLSGVNLQVVNGTGSTNSANGLGNVIIGYDVANTNTFGSVYFCSNGAYTDQATCQSNGDTWALSQKSGSHYLVIGDGNSYTQYAGLVAGSINVSNAPYASVLGGTGNVASGLSAVALGGQQNIASGALSTASGGGNNIASGSAASVSGGIQNNATGNSSSVSGGRYNAASGQFASVSGGAQNTASGDYSSVTGGLTHSATSTYNWAAGTYSSPQ